ncbi:MAG: DUF4258 domain-containing protein [Deltaproteobacteria bacterium]|nr:DUF4258 domain-containing protein [Deltaproteobacteria bacterium]
MEIKYSSHAVQRMVQRNVSTQEVEFVLTDPDGTIKQSKDKYIFYKKMKLRKDNMIAAVVVRKKRKLCEVLTVLINFEVVK